MNNKMKIAVASDDKVSICAHFGRTLGFLKFNTEGDKIIHKEYIRNDFTGHAQGHHHAHDHDHNQPHSHGGILTALKDCQVVISRGMGRRLYIDFQQANKEVFISNESDAQKAVELYLQGNLTDHPEKGCEY
jgi:predicted Fe-Mo cluster-binding NifX family protein